MLFRATWPSTDYMFYSISPKSQKKAAASPPSYLQKTPKYRKLAYGLKSGFIFDTIFGNPKDHQDYAVLCSFPIDAATDDRAQQGCTDCGARRTASRSPVPGHQRQHRRAVGGELPAEPR